MIFLATFSSFSKSVNYKDDDDRVKWRENFISHNCTNMQQQHTNYNESSFSSLASLATNSTFMQITGRGGGEESESGLVDYLTSGPARPGYDYTLSGL